MYCGWIRRVGAKGLYFYLWLIWRDARSDTHGVGDLGIGIHVQLSLYVVVKGLGFFVVVGETPFGLAGGKKIG